VNGLTVVEKGGGAGDGDGLALQAWPDAPEHLSDEAVAIWNELLSEYRFDPGGQAVLLSGLESFDRMREAQKAIEDNGILLENKAGTSVENPACRIERDSRKLYLHALKMLNMDLEPLRNRAGRPTQGSLF